MDKKLVLIDGHSILNRSFFGLPDLTNSEGFHTNAIYGFLNIMFRIIDEEKPTNIAVAFDVHHPTFRHEVYKEYKGTRKPMADELRMQVPAMKEMLKAMGILVMEKAGLEADDILGTMAKRAEKEGIEVTLVSGDRDLLQIATDKIKIRIPKTKSGKTTVEDYYANDVKEKIGLTPLQFIELKALMGDSSDNIPGLPKVGEKTALELMTTYGSIAAIYEHVEEISKKSIKESLLNNKDILDLCLFLVTINIDADIPFSIEETKLGNIFTPKAYELCKKYNFKNLYSKFDANMNISSCSELKKDFYTVDSMTSMKELLEKANKSKQIGISIAEIEGASNEDADGQLSLFNNAEDSGRSLVAIAVEDSCALLDSKKLDKTTIQKEIMNLHKQGIMLKTCNVKKLYKYLNMKNCTSKEASRNIDDVIIGAYLINPLKNDYSYPDIAGEYLGCIVKNYEELCGKKSIKESVTECYSSLMEYLCQEAYVALKSSQLIVDKLTSEQMLELYRNIEMPTSYVLYAMEKEGVIADKEALTDYGNLLNSSIIELEESIFDKAGEKFNINSPKQLATLLFEKMQLPGGKKTKTGYSTAADVLEKLAVDYPIVKEILEYRTLTKLKSTYADGLQAFIKEDNRIHTNFNQTITATGRISSTEPNLQNIPMRYELGRKIRKVFIPKEGFVFLDADYSQIELRILASMSGDKELIEAYKTGEDIHAITASKVFHIPLDKVTEKERRNAKAVNFGIVYGISSYGLGQDLSISKKQAQQNLEEYFESYRGVYSFLENCKTEAKANGYSVTMFGRRRPIPELASSNFMQKSFGERVAMNAPIQGTAADIMKLAMVNVFDRLVTEQVESKMILQIHDELVIETKEEEKEKVKNILLEEMVNAAKLPVRLEVSYEFGNDLYEAK